LLLNTSPNAASLMPSILVSTIISGINWTVNDIQTRGRIGKATALLAVGGSFSAALNSAVAAASNAGVMFAVAAGGDGSDAGNTSPGSEPTACTVGATTTGDARASSSNYGSAGTFCKGLSASKQSTDCLV
jgi:oryzin